MKKLIFLFSLLVCSACVMAQSETIILKPGDSLDDFKTKYVYRLPNFVPSRIIYKDGAVTQGKMNYNLSSQKVEFIGPAGDTLELIDDIRVKEVVLAKTTFRYDKGYYELLKDNPVIKLGMKRPLREVSQRKIGAMGIASSSTGADAYGSVLDFSGLRKITLNVQHVFSFTPVYYIGNSNNQFVPATTKNLLKIVPDKKDVIAIYLKNNLVNFGKLEDILALLAHIQKP